MSAIFLSSTLPPPLLSSPTSFSSPDPSIPHLFLSSKTQPCPLLLSSFSYSFPRKARTLVFSSNPSEQEPELSSSSSSTEEDEWLKKLPDKTKPVYSHSLPCVEAWLRNLGFYQSNDDRAVWLVEMPEWHAQLSLDVTELYIRYLKSGPGNIDKDVERRFSYALSREDVENAILGGP